MVEVASAWLERPARLPLALLLVVAASSSGCRRARASGASIRVEAPHARVFPNGMGAAYLTIVNAGSESDQLQAVTAAWAKSVELHETVQDGDVVSMREVDGGLEVPAGGSIALEPGGRHLMLEGVRLALNAQSAPLTLSFAHLGSMVIEVRIDRSGF